MQSNKEKDREISKRILNSVINENMMLVQAILCVFLIVFGIISFFEKELMPISEILFGITCLVMGYNNHKIYKRKGITVVYIIVGIISFMLAGITLYG